MINKEVRIDWKDKTARPKVESVMLDPNAYYFKREYNDGCILAFYSHGSWGGVCDRFRGWVIIKIIDKSNGKVVSVYELDSLERKTYREWLSEQKKLHKGYKQTFKYSDGQDLWKMNE